MSRAADYTIQGFLYQFNKSILEILNADDTASVKLEGVIEDIEIVSPTSTTGIQCKYHEASAGFTPSAIFKPLLQMLLHYAAHPTNKIEYVLFAHFPNIDKIPPSVGKAELQSALLSKDKSLKSLISAMPSPLDIDGFIKMFKMEFSPCYDELVKQVTTALVKNGISNDDIETLAYPNAINIVAELSILHDPKRRQITRREFLDRLNKIRITAISRWTMALKSKEALLKARRKQLKVQLDKNTRRRYFVIDPKSFGDYESEIIFFLNDFIDKYHFKPTHINTPILCLCTTRDEAQKIQHRLYAKGIVTTDGYVGSQFEEAHFFREPLLVKSACSKVQREFALRLTTWLDHGNVLNNKKCDDLFILGEPDCSSLEANDVNVERISGVSFKEIKFLMGVSSVYE
ncbi:hypothetical protein MASR1M12_09850 [Erysipelotrichia bacterium]